MATQGVDEQTRGGKGRRRRGTALMSMHPWRTQGLRNPGKPSRQEDAKVSKLKPRVQSLPDKQVYSPTAFLLSLIHI